MEYFQTFYFFLKTKIIVFYLKYILSILMKFSKWDENNKKFKNFVFLNWQNFKNKFNSLDFYRYCLQYSQESPFFDPSQDRNPRNLHLRSLCRVGSSVRFFLQNKKKFNVKTNQKLKYENLKSSFRFIFSQARKNASSLSMKNCYQLMITWSLVSTVTYPNHHWSWPSLILTLT